MRGFAGHTVGTLSVEIRVLSGGGIKRRVLLCRRENTGILEGDVE